MSTFLKLLCVLVAILAVHSVKADTGEDFTEWVKSIEIFKLKTSSLGCPLPVVGASCPEETPLYYFKCCGRIADSCCFRLQDWVLVLVCFLVVCIVLSIIVNIIRCLCCV
ncbi:hypothetical protein WR25_04254 [Diploscapter pachys]|uniref:Uncharacterized protein n=1 Tax=Diploscapter pachys TaxID=2018661 RepID=A0A2A2K1B5_9BILA|nr:hypothetical protein WR25_04254 [Diploscapter pachys]